MGIDLGNLAALRTFRVLRALKTVAIIPGKIVGWSDTGQKPNALYFDIEWYFLMNTLIKKILSEIFVRKKKSFLFN